MRELLDRRAVALSIVLLIGAGLMIRSLWQLQQVKPGFAAEQVLTLGRLAADGALCGRRADAVLRAARRAHPRAAWRDRVGAINILPLSANYDSRGVQVEDHPQPDGPGHRPQARSVTPGYFARDGHSAARAARNFDAHDVEARPLVVVVSESMARQYWPGEDPDRAAHHVQQRHPARGSSRSSAAPGSRVVIGVVGNVKHLGLDEATCRCSTRRTRSSRRTTPCRWWFARPPIRRR